MLTEEFYELNKNKWELVEVETFKKCEPRKKKLYQIFFKYFETSISTKYHGYSFKELFKQFANNEDYSENGLLLKKWLKIQNIENDEIFKNELIEALKDYKKVNLRISY